MYSKNGTKRSTGCCSPEIRRAAALFQSARRVVIGGGAGLSAAAGLLYSGPRFTGRFAPFIAKYGLTDMYSAGFYPFPNERARWAYWAQHILVNRIEPPALPLYRQLHDLVGAREHFVITTNVDHQFQKAGFAPARVFAVQGDYGELQCARACHGGLYPAEPVVRALSAATRDCLVPDALVPRCPVCGGKMAVHLRVDQSFVEDDSWHAACARYEDFLRACIDVPTVLLELGVGFNTPGIIRYPFERLALAYENFSLIRVNLSEARLPDELKSRGVSLAGDIKDTLSALAAR